MKSYFLSFLSAILCYSISFAQASSTNYDESKVPPYTLPDPLISPEGKSISTVRQWEKKQRPYILKLFTDHVYGKIPGRPAGMHFKVTGTDTTVLNGTAIRKQVTIYFLAGDNAPSMNLLLYLPKANHPVAVFAGMNFEAPLEEMIRKGYGVAIARNDDLEPDDKAGWKKGIRSTMKDALHIATGDWSAISAWAWGMSRMQDYLETDTAVDAKRTILIGHSRLGKTALWAAANDRRFSIVISNNSGKGGAALSRRIFGEPIQHLNTSFPHWFIARYKSYSNHPELLPVDQHELLALIAPRLLYVASAEDDKWADPKGEFLSLKAAEPVYALYRLPGLIVNEMPPVNTPVGVAIGYHIRQGRHDLTLYDWQQYITFAERHKNRK